MIEIQCPSAETLRQWTSGEIDEATANELTEHLRQCTDCQTILADQDHRDSDSLIQQLKAADPLLEFRSEHDCQQASILAMGAITGQAMEETHTAMPVFPKEMEDYRLLELIASGGMGKVYRAHHQRLGRDVAIKIISGRRLADANASLRFEQEIRALGRLSHPNIVSALDARQADGSPILIMEYVDGLDLSQIVKRLGALPASSVAAIGRAVAAAIAYASSHGLVHRDIKPSNIMINGKGEVKLLDLGLARIQLDGHVAPEWTGTGLAVGTPDYMSPEQINDSQTINSQSDLYSLGCTLYRLLVGHPPYGGSKYRSNFEKLAAHVSEAPIRISNAKAQYPAELVSIIERLLSKSPEDRPDSAQTIALELEKLSTGADLAGLLAMARKLQTADTSATPSSPEQLLPSPSRGSGRIGSIVRWTAALGGIPVGILLGIWLTVHNSDGTQNKVQLPSNSSATIDDKGNIQVDMANTGNTQGGSNQATDNPITAESVGLAQNANSNGSTGVNSRRNNSTPSDAEIKSSLNAIASSSEPLFRGYPREAWLKVLQNERSGGLLILAGEAVISLSENAEQKAQAMKLLLIKSRDLGGYNTDELGDESAKWMNMLRSKAYTLFPQPFIDVAIEEVQSGNAKSMQAILSLCHGATKEQLQTNVLQFNPGSDVSQLFQTPDWRPFIAALAQASDRITIKVPGIWDDSNYFLDDTLVLADRLGLSYSSLDPRLQSESKKFWEAAQLKPLKYEPYNYYTYANTPWLPYWRTLPQSENHRVFMIKAIFANLDYASGVSQELLEGLGALTPAEQTEVCEFLADRFDEFNATSFVSSDRWAQVFKYLGQASTLDKSNIARAQKMASDLSTALFSQRNRQSQAHMGVRWGESVQVEAPPERDVAKFRELLGLPPKSDPVSFVGNGSGFDNLQGSNKPSQSSPNAPTKNSTNNDAQSTTQDDNINAWVKASESTDKPLFRGFPFDTWIKALESERSFDNQLVATEAVLALAETPEQKYAAAKQVLRVSRGIDRRDNSQGSNSNKWVKVLFPSIFGLLPDPFLKAAIEEIPQGNHNSILTIYYVALPIGDPASTGWNLPKAQQLATSPLWETLISELSHVKEPQELIFPEGQRSPLIDEALNLSSGLNIPFENLDPALQAESKRQWEKLLQAEVPQEPVDFRSRNLPPQAWLPYWLSLPQTDNHKLRAIQAIFFNINGARRQSRRILAHIEEYTPQELTEVSKLLVDRYDMFDFETDKAKQIWDRIFDGLHRDGKLGDANLEKAFNTVCKLLDTYTGETKYQRAYNSGALPPQLQKSEFHKLLGSPYGDKFVEPLQAKQPSQAARPKSSTNNDAQSTTKDDNINAWVKASESTDKPLFRGFPFDTWIKALESERDFEAQLVAGRAVLTLAESAGERTAATKAVLKGSRNLGGNHTEGSPNDYSAKWMAMLVSKFNLFFPDPFLNAAIEEVPKANAKSVFAILTVCLRAAKERYLKAGSDPNGAIRSIDPGWKKLVQELSIFKDQEALMQDEKEYLIIKICELADHLDIPYSELDPTLQQESKGLWEAALNQSLQYDASSRQESGTAWLPYWFTLPQKENHKPFMVRAVFANLDHVQNSSQEVFGHFDTLTTDEQTEICSFILDRYRNFRLTGSYLTDAWENLFDCLRRCSTLEKSSIDEAAKMIAKARSEYESMVRNHGSSAPGQLDTPKFRQLLGLPPDVGPGGPGGPGGAGASAPKANANKSDQPQPASQDAELDTLMSNSGSGKALFRGYDFDKWAASLHSERSVSLQLLAGEAVIATADTPDQKLQAVKLILEKSRELGGHFIGDNNDSQKWMSMLRSKIYRLFPEPFLQAAVEEVKQGNEKSLLAIFSICRGAASEQLLLEKDSRWPNLINALAQESSRKSIKVSGIWEGSNYILAETLSLADRIPIPFTELDPILQAESKRLWEAALKNDMPTRPMYGYTNSTPWMPYWKSLPQQKDHKAFMVRALIVNLDGVQASSQEILDRFATFTPEEQTAVCQTLLERYSQSDFRYPNSDRIWNQIFDCLRRCSSLDKASIDKAAALVTNARALAAASVNGPQAYGAQNFSFPLEVDPKILDRLLGHPFGKPDSEGVAPPLPTPYWNKPEKPTYIRPETSGGVF